MFVLYGLFRRCVGSAPSKESNGDHPPSPTSVPTLDSEKNPAVLLWLATFGFVLWFELAAVLVVRVLRILLFSACALLIGTLDGSLNLVVGHAVLRAAKRSGYDPPLPLSAEAGSLGGLVVIGPATIASISLIALLGGLGIQRALSRFVSVLLELASAAATSAAAGSVGVTIIRRMHPDGTPLDRLHAARAGALGACLVTVPLVSTAALLLRLREPHPALSMPSQTESDVDTPPTSLADGRGRPVAHDASRARHRTHARVIARTAAETVGYVLVTLCILSIRLLCF